MKKVMSGRNSGKTLESAGDMIYEKEERRRHFLHSFPFHRKRKVRGIQ